MGLRNERWKDRRICIQFKELRGPVGTGGQRLATITKV